MGYPTSPYERPESLNSNSNTKQSQTKAERRAEHNATERARRENLNVKFQQLAFTLPNLQNDSRPSKGTIIDRTLDFVKGAIIKEERMQYRINELEKFSRYLLSELDKKNNSSTPVATKEEEIVEDLLHTSPPPPITHTITNSPPSSVVSDDTTATTTEELMKAEFASSIKKLTSNTRQKENGITKRRPVSRTSVSMIPKLDYPTTTINNTNWPIANTKTTPSLTTKKSTHFHPQRVVMLDQQQQLIKESPSMQFQQTFHQPILFQQTNNKFMNGDPEQQQLQDNFMLDHHQQFNTNNTTFMLNTNSFNNNNQIMEQLQHRR